MIRAFADTFYFLALLNRQDRVHERAVKFSASVRQLVTTEWVLTELADGLAAPRHRNMFLQTRQALLGDGNVQIVPLDGQLYESGIQLYAKRPDKAWSLTDCISFQVMQQESLREALTGDHHFEQAGFIALLR